MDKDEKFVKDGLKSGYTIKELRIASQKNGLSTEKFNKIIKDMEKKTPKNFLIRHLAKRNSASFSISLILLLSFYFLIVSLVILYGNVLNNTIFMNVLLVILTIIFLIILGPWLVFLYVIIPNIGLGWPKKLSFFNLGFGFHINESIIIYAVILLFSILIFINYKHKKFLRSFKSGLELPLVLFFTAIMLSSINSNNIPTFFKTAGQFFISFLLFYLVFSYINNNRKIKQLTWAILIVFFIASVISIGCMNKTFDKHTNNLLGIERGEVDLDPEARITGVWNQHNLTTIFNFALILGLALYMYSKKIIQKIILLIFTTSICFATLVSNTRTNYIALLSIISLFFLFTKQKKKYFIGLFIVLFISFSAYSILGQGFSRWNTAVLTGGAILDKDTTQDINNNQLESINELSATKTNLKSFFWPVFPKNNEKGWIELKSDRKITPWGKLVETSLIVHQSNYKGEGMPFVDYIVSESRLNQYTNGRFMLGRIGLAIYNNYPLIGNSFSAHYTHDFYDGTRYTAGLHNFYIQLLASTGILGFLTFMFLIYKTYKKDFELFLKNKFRNNPILMAFSIGSLAILLDGIAQNGPGYWNMLFMFFIYRGVIHAYANNIIKIKE